MILEYGQDCGNRPDWVPKLLPSLRPGSPSPRGQVRGRFSPSLAEREMGQCSMPLVDTGIARISLLRALQRPGSTAGGVEGDV